MHARNDLLVRCVEICGFYILYTKCALCRYIFLKWETTHLHENVIWIAIRGGKDAWLKDQRIITSFEDRYIKYFIKAPKIL